MMAALVNDMKSEFKRYATFSEFLTPAGVWPSQLASAGFYRVAGSRTQVVCFACGLQVDVDVFAGESVKNVHQRLSPICSFLQGSSENHPFPSVEVQGIQGFDLEWLTQNFDSVASNGSSNRDFQFYSLPPNMLDCDVADDGGSAEDSVTAFSSLPQFNCSQYDLVPVLPIFSDLNTLEQTTTNLDSLPMDLVDGLANANLQSISPSSLFGVVGSDPASQPFGSIFGGSEDLVADGVSAGVEGVAPPPLMQDSDIGNYTSQQSAPPSSQDWNAPELEVPKQKITYDDLGIIVQRPKRQEMTTLGNRLKSFEKWQGGKISQSLETIAEAGFYYAGYSDCCRCFYCGGGLKSWVKEDDPWIEHARWFKECPYVKTSKGVEFISAVQSLAKTNNVISMEDVDNEIKQLKQQSELMSDCDDLTCDFGDNIDTNSEVSRLEKENDTLKRPDMCKVCLDEEVGVLFVPCGHLVTCFRCSPSVLACPVCRQQIQGRVRICRGD